MAFSLPTFNINVSIYDGPWPAGPVRVATKGNLAWGRRVTQQGSLFVVPSPLENATNASMTLLLPPGTDIRAFPLYPVSDLVQVPGGSGRWYAVIFVDDIGKGFSNEHRAAVLAQISEHVNAALFAGLEWPVPMP